MDLKIFSGKRICVAISGGVDSVVLLHYLKSLEKQSRYHLSAVHCEHGIRGEESVEDMRFVQNFCDRLQIPLHIFKEDCIARAKRDKESLETAARNFRRQSFDYLVAQDKTDYVATAHHCNDDAETVLFRLARGTLSGVKGIQPQNGYLLRPLLTWTKQEILAYAEQNGLVYREDKTNTDTQYTRNKIRQEVLPKLEQCVVGATQNIARFANLYQADDDLLYELAKPLCTQEKRGYLVAFSDKKPLFCRACLTAMKGLGIEKDYTTTHLEDAFALQNLQRGAQLSLPKGVVAKKTEKGVYFCVEGQEIFPDKPQPQKFSENGFDGGRYEVICSKTAIQPQNEWQILRFDKEKIPSTAIYRFRKEGDEIQRFGGGKKSLKKFFNEEKIPPQEREYIPLIADEKSGEVYAVCGVEISEKIKVQTDTKSVLYMTIRRKEEV